MSDDLRVFIDSNVLFSAAYKTPNEFEKLWALPRVSVLTSQYVIGEVTRNLRQAASRARLWSLIYGLHLVDNGDEVVLAEGISLPEKDQPTLRTAIDADADILLTGDAQHFSAYFGAAIQGVLVESPRMFKRRYPQVFRSSAKHES